MTAAADASGSAGHSGHSPFAIGERSSHLVHHYYIEYWSYCFVASSLDFGLNFADLADPGKYRPLDSEPLPEPSAGTGSAVGLPSFDESGGCPDSCSGAEMAARVNSECYSGFVKNCQKCSLSCYAPAFNSIVTHLFYIVFACTQASRPTAVHPAHERSHLVVHVDYRKFAW